jgi:hypothetical protein
MMSSFDGLNPPQGMGPQLGAAAGAPPGPPGPHLLATISRFLHALRAPAGLPPMWVTSWALQSPAEEGLHNAALAEAIGEVLRGRELQVCWRGVCG